ncbi:hypothetical protein VTJ04DRAFT_9014 [Mycothermus thermophilus]|uniref:uncharacterized protein n=1 Tax=Humicola insolens TaxID=85995 RepID=UPI0037426AC6
MNFWDFALLGTKESAGRAFFWVSFRSGFFWVGLGWVVHMSIYVLQLGFWEPGLWLGMGRDIGLRLWLDQHSLIHIYKQAQAPRAMADFFVLHNWRFGGIGFCSFFL